MASSGQPNQLAGSASSSQPNQPGSASSSQLPNPTGSRSERARKVWDDLTEFLLSDENNLDMFRCGLCNDIMMDVTVVTKCQHGFCESCIQEHVIYNGIHVCPRCPTDLGDNPAQYLRYDKLTSDLIELVVEYHDNRNEALEDLQEQEPDTVPTAPEPDTVPPAPEPTTQDSDAANGAN